MAALLLTANSGSPTVAAVRARLEALEQEFNQRAPNEMMQHMFQNMTEPQMLKLQERFGMAGRNTDQRFAAIAKATFEDLYKQIEDARGELKSMEQVLANTATLTMMTQFCNDQGLMNWEAFTKVLNETTTEKSRQVGARAGR